MLQSSNGLHWLQKLGGKLRCECGNTVVAWKKVVVGYPGARGPNTGTLTVLSLCQECAEVEKEFGLRGLVLEVAQEVKRPFNWLDVAWDDIERERFLRL